MTPDEFNARCTTIWHVAFPGAWDRISRVGFQTANQLIDEALGLSDIERHALKTDRRRESITLYCRGEPVRIRDQGPLFGRKDLSVILDEDLTVSEWIHLLNDRVYFFADEQAMRKVVDKYVAEVGAQEVITLSPRRFLKAAGDRLELSATNSGSIARKKGPQKSRRTFLPLHEFPAGRPAEITVVDGLADLSPVICVERHRANGLVERLQ